MGFAPIAVLALFGFILQLAVPIAYAQDNGFTESSQPPLQIANLTGIKVVAQINSADTIPNGISKQVLAIKNLTDQYTALGMTAGKDYEIAMVFRGDGAHFLLNDEMYDARVKQPHPKGNPNRKLLEALHKSGVQIYQCNVAMKLLGYEVKDILPFSRLVVSGIGAIVDFEKSGYLPITP